MEGMTVSKTRFGTMGRLEIERPTGAITDPQFALIERRVIHIGGPGGWVVDRMLFGTRVGSIMALGRDTSTSTHISERTEYIELPEGAIIVPYPGGMLTMWPVATEGSEAPSLAQACRELEPLCTAGGADFMVLDREPPEGQSAQVLQIWRRGRLIWERDSQTCASD